MEQDCWTFLAGFSADELEHRGILRPFGDRYLLRKESVVPLLTLMKERRVARLVAREGHWFLTSDGEFANRGSPTKKRGRVTDLGNWGDVFTTQNPHINPHYDRSQSPAILPKPPVSSSTLTPRHLTADELDKMRRSLLQIMDGVEGRASGGEKITSRVRRLQLDGWIPRLVAQAMLIVNEARNIGVYDRHSFSTTENVAVRAAWEVVREWALSENLEAALTI